MTHDHSSKIETVKMEDNNITLGNLIMRFFKSSAFTRKMLAIWLVLHCVTISAQETQYEEMKRTMNETSLPLVNMLVDIASVNQSYYVQGEIEITDYQRRTSPSSSTVRYLCQYRIRGGSAAGYAKKSFAVKLCDEQGEDLDANILGIREENSWILDAMAIDRTRMRNRICFDVWNALSRTPYDTKYGNRNGTKGVFVELFINGDYHGLYCMSDKIDRKLLGLKKVKVDEEDSVTVKGLLYKGISWGSGYHLRFYNEADVNKVTWNAWELQYPDDYPSADTWQPLMDLMDFCSDEMPDDVFRQGYQDYFYVENLIDYAVFTMALNVGDNAYKNTFLSVVDITKGHRYLLTPWDMDMSLGGNWNGDYNPSLASIDRYSIIAPFCWLTERNIDGFNYSEVSRWQEYYTTLFSCDSINRRLDDYAELFTTSGAWEREYAKWNGMPVPLKQSIADELEYVKDWYRQNYESLCAQFGVDIPVGITYKNTPNAPASNKIYTLDGRTLHHPLMQPGIYIKNGKKVVVG